MRSAYQVQTVMEIYYRPILFASVFSVKGGGRMTPSLPEAFTAYTQAVEELEAQMQRARNGTFEQFAAILKTARESGWQEFEFLSEYYGSHSEMGERDERFAYFFSPSVDISAWQGVRFSHGHRSASDSNVAFETWLGTMTEGEHYIRIRDPYEYS